MISSIRLPTASEACFFDAQNIFIIVSLSLTEVMQHDHRCSLIYNMQYLTSILTIVFFLHSSHEITLFDSAERSNPAEGIFGPSLVGSLMR